MYYNINFLYHVRSQTTMLIARDKESTVLFSTVCCHSSHVCFASQIVQPHSMHTFFVQSLHYLDPADCTIRDIRFAVSQDVRQ